MVVETTYPDKEVTKIINDTVGKSYSFFQRIKLGGIGSHRIQIQETSEELAQYINPGHSVNNLNIELRPGGVLIHLKRRTETYCWIVPFSELRIPDDFSKISDGEYFIELKNGLQHNTSFFKTLNKLSQLSLDKV